MKYVRVVVEKYPSHYSAYTIGLKETLRGEGATFEEAFNTVKAILNSHAETYGSETLEPQTPILEAFIAEAALNV